VPPGEKGVPPRVFGCELHAASARVFTRFPAGLDARVLPFYLFFMILCPRAVQGFYSGGAVQGNDNFFLESSAGFLSSFAIPVSPYG